MPWFTKKRKKKESLTFSAIFKVDFGRFWHVSAGRYGSILAKSARFDVNRSRFSTNRAKSAWIREKKKNADADRRAGNCVGCRILRRAALDAGAAPLVPRSSFLANKWLVRCNWTLNPNFGPFLLGFFYCWIVEVVLEGR